ncbi:hypothetical protein N7481_011025 [Penicillium waksmanii]|uniref:uncharacterized protein n=1 Tax=Penicillium waksmanii TaxID=69791 RepID=UPI0025466AF7|nr:uncharacterized protein N7481_011025 [Penicillium waksmanii]KAJ5973815.1 hypothetical protein N7481_011025 [Penicillium waksmanii]
MAAEPFVFDAGIYAMTAVEEGRLDALTGQVDISSSPKKGIKCHGECDEGAGWRTRMDQLQYRGGSLTVRV